MMDWSTSPANDSWINQLVPSIHGVSFLSKGGKKYNASHISILTACFLPLSSIYSKFHIFGFKVCWSEKKNFFLKTSPLRLGNCQWHFWQILEAKQSIKKVTGRSFNLKNDQKFKLGSPFSGLKTFTQMGALKRPSPWKFADFQPALYRPTTQFLVPGWRTISCFNTDQILLNSQYVTHQWFSTIWATNSTTA